MFILKAIWMGVSMFCALPCPCPPWDEDLRPWMTALLGLVGLWIGVLWAVIALVCHQWLPPLLCAAAITITPWLLSGFLHLDGFMDCADAILSRRDLAQRRVILKDSACGAFSVIAFVCLALIGFGAVGSWSGVAPWTLVWIAMVPRCASALAVMTLPPLSSSQYATNKASTQVLVTAWCLLLLSLATAWCYQPTALVCALTALVGWSLACGGAYRNLQGMSGDISGYAITLGETCGLVALALV